MDGIDLQSIETVRAFADGTIEWPNLPWRHADVAEGYYKWICREICRDLQLSSRNDFDAYGSGYASFFDAWFYKENSQFRMSGAGAEHQEFTGLFVLLNRFAPLYALGEGTKSWQTTRFGGSSYLPVASMVDSFRTDVVEALSGQVEWELSKRDMTRLSSAEVMALISPDIEIETNLCDGKLRLFDALFHWMD